MCLEKKGQAQAWHFRRSRPGKHAARKPDRRQQPESKQGIFAYQWIFLRFLRFASRIVAGAQNRSKQTWGREKKRERERDRKSFAARHAHAQTHIRLPLPSWRGLEWVDPKFDDANVVKLYHGLLSKTLISRTITCTGVAVWQYMAYAQ